MPPAQLEIASSWSAGGYKRHYTICGRCYKTIEPVWYLTDSVRKELFATGVPFKEILQLNESACEEQVEAATKVPNWTQSASAAQLAQQVQLRLRTFDCAIAVLTPPHDKTAIHQLTRAHATHRTFAPQHTPPHSHTHSHTLSHMHTDK